MRKKRVAIVVVSILAVVLVGACIVAGGPMLMNMMRSMHTIPQH